MKALALTNSEMNFIERLANEHRIETPTTSTIAKVVATKQTTRWYRPANHVLHCEIATKHDLIISKFLDYRRIVDIPEIILSAAPSYAADCPLPMTMLESYGQTAKWVIHPFTAIVEQGLDVESKTVKEIHEDRLADFDEEKPYLVFKKNSKKGKLMTKRALVKKFGNKKMFAELYFAETRKSSFGGIIIF